jgi:hypothetical protein
MDNKVAAKRGRRVRGDQTVRLSIWSARGSGSIDRDGSERDLVPEFHRLKEAGEVMRLELSGVYPVGGLWLSWDNPAFGPTPAARACPHCGGTL